ncbi:MAG: translation initiation factor IF-3 [Deltaproteobacteria bacterium]|nr:translation initiation factor IF-3 [Deltaproteobacteria bacterium]
MPTDTHRVNKAIMAREVRVIGEDGKQLGVMPTHIACRIAEEKGMDLVEVNPKGTPPVCKIIDHGRFKYEEARKKRASKKKQAVVVVKEVKLRPKTDKHDLDVKVRSIIRFLAEGNKAKLVVAFRGREIVHPETGRAVLLKVLTELGDYAVVEQMPLMDGRRMTMLVAPKPGANIPLPKKTEAERTKAPGASDEDEDRDEDDVDDDEDDDTTEGSEGEDAPAEKAAPDEAAPLTGEAGSEVNARP